LRAVVWSPQAIKALQRIARYVGQRDESAAELVRGRLDAAAIRLGIHATGRPGRYKGTYEKTVPGTSHILQYSIRRSGDREFILIRAIVHSRRNWPPGEPPPAPSSP